ncbi:carbohydrate binding family 9 domain-containing protein [Christiangramia sabulilitoris]|uniref:Carbohydrate binding family 9 domain-containing protein n=1 Tax=Christiangramia sabulilitoris TaxID=2583991 RepID=A0A550I0Q1_9FLAO|nr:carbohydrate binding family 9 domain-containing protein [Christiangramia sabulilitoris]
MKFTFGLLIIACFSHQINAQSSSDKKPDLNLAFAKRSYTTTSINDLDPIKIDGIIDDDAWDAVEWTSDYVEWEPDNNTDPSQQTKMKIVYDSRNLYVAFRCYEPDPEKIIQRMGRRDDFPGDWIELNIDSYNDDRTAFSFTTSVSGVKGDEFISNNGNFDSSWNPIWYVKTNIDEEGWTAELRIPLSQLRFSNDKDQVWGIQSTRRYFSKEERSTWQPVPANPAGWVSSFGELRGLKNLEPQKQLEIQPYTVTKYKSYEQEAGNPYRDGNDEDLTVGLDAKIGITNDLTVDLTINPDFGQVDADPGAVTLDGFEIFFQERRPFFVENKSVFDYRFTDSQNNLFFSRRIGRSPQGQAFGPGVVYADSPVNTTILGAAKFSGKTENGWTIGVLESVTAKEYAGVINTNGEEDEVLVEPLTNYFVGRVQKDFNDRNSYVGTMFTATHRNIEDDLTFLHTQAFSGGLDFKHNWKDRTYYLEGHSVISHVRGSKEAILNTQNSIVHLFQRTDADHVEVDPNRTSLTGTGGRLEFGKGGGGNWRYRAGGKWISPELETNDIGFLRQADDIRQYAGVNRLFTRPTSWFRRANIGIEQSSVFDFEGNYNRMQYELRSSINYKNNWWSEFGAAHKPRIFVNSFLRGGPRWRFNEENYWFLFSGTDQRKKLSFRAGYVHAQAKQNAFGLRRYVVGTNYQPLNALNLSLELEYEQNPSKTQYITERSFNGAARYILGQIDQETLSATLRVNYSINPNLSIQYYGQPFIFKADYSNLNFVQDATARDINKRISWYGDDQIAFENNSYLIDENRDNIIDYSVSNPDFTFVQFRSNLVARWEYIPGSEIFFVWSQGVTGLGDVDNDFSAIVDNQLLRQRPQNTFLIKATYRFIL